MVFPNAKHIETNLVRKLRRRDHFCDPPFCAHAHSSIAAAAKSSIPICMPLT
jgi:hypothetical protein